jgi:TolA-binding protein
MRRLWLMNRAILVLVLVGCGSQTKKTEPPTPTEQVPAPDAAPPEAPAPAQAMPPPERMPIDELEPAMPPPKRKQTQADIAASLTNEGIELMKQGSFEAASNKFRDAVARIPEPRYFFNLCVSLYQQGRFVEALTACDAVKDTTPKLEQKTITMMQRILDAAGRQGIEVK